MTAIDRPPITPSQIRAGRALLDWSQEQLAEKAKVGLSTVRDYEKERRSGNLAGAKAIQSALEGRGVIFLPSEGDYGPGVRLVASMPNLLRRLTKANPYHWDGFTISIEWRGHEFEVFLSQEALDDLGKFNRIQPEREYVALFEENRDLILSKAASEIKSGNVTPDRRVYLLSRNF